MIKKQIVAFIISKLYLNTKTELYFENALQQWWSNAPDSKQNGALEFTVWPGYSLCSHTEKVRELMLKKTLKFF